MKLRNSGKLAELKERIRQEEQAKLELKIWKIIQEEEDKILRKSGCKRVHRDISPELISYEDELEEDLIHVIREL